MIKFTKKGVAILISLAFASNLFAAGENINDVKSVKQDDTHSLQRRSFLPKSQYKRVSRPEVFIPKGQWMAGATVSYGETSADNVKFLILDDINTTGYNVKTEVFAGYAFKNDAIAGLRLGYKRSMADLKNISLNLGEDMNFDIQNAYSLSHSFIGTAFLRNYISVFNSNRFALFNDVQIYYERGEGKTTNGTGDNFSGTYSRNSKFVVGISPGLVAFMNDFAAFEASVGVLGFESSWTKQMTDQVETGKFHRSSANFKLDLFSIKLGVTFYFNSKKIN